MLSCTVSSSSLQQLTGPTHITLPQMLSLHLFPALRTLKLVSQGISEISGLQGCTALERLWLPENRIRSIQGLEGLGRLRELYLCSNRWAGPHHGLRIAAPML